MLAIKIAAAFMLVILLCLAGWTLTHLGRIKSQLIANDLMPRETPRNNFLIMLSAAFIAICVLLLAFLRN